MKTKGVIVLADYKFRQRSVSITGVDDVSKLANFAGGLKSYTNAKIVGGYLVSPARTAFSDVPSVELGQDSIDDKMLVAFSATVGNEERRIVLTLFGVKHDYLDDSGGLYVQLQPAQGLALAAALSTLTGYQCRYVGSRQRRKGYLPA
jgi:hypothetical protein